MSDTTCGSGGNGCFMCPTGQTCGGGGVQRQCGGSPTGCVLPDGGPLILAGNWVNSGGPYPATLQLTDMGGGSYNADLSLSPISRGASCPSSGAIQATFTVNATSQGAGQCLIQGTGPSVGGFSASIQMQATENQLNGKASPPCQAPPYTGMMIP
jgi:hypothetical protein